MPATESKRRPPNTATPRAAQRRSDARGSAGGAVRRSRGSARVEAGRVVHEARKGARKRKARRHRYTAKTADKYDLYQKAVQSADIDVEFLSRVFRNTRGRKALRLREDFCGTGLISSWWIRQSEEHTAEGFDIDPDPVAWGLVHNFESLGEAARRYTVHLKDVREPGHVRPDLRIAQNFSYNVFKTRAEMLSYFRAARESLVDDGMFVIDLHGGPEATEEMEEERRCGGFTYVWDQESFWPGTGDYTAHIHFRFPDGTELRKAFTYRWRMWYLTELRDVMLDAGFRRVESYFEGTDESGEEGNGVFRKGVRGENCLSWIAYMAGLK